MKTVALLFVLFIASTVHGQLSVEYVLFTDGLQRPIDIVNRAGSDYLYVVEQAGRIERVLPDGTIETTPFIDITSSVNSGSNERGLLGLAFHPNYPLQPYCYVNYIKNNGDTRIARFTVDTATDVAIVGSEETILEVDQPFSNHNAGDLSFGPDGYLYIPLGDGGNAGDPGGRAQNLMNLLGKLLRLDIDSLPYRIPDDNPYAHTDFESDEIWAYGLRNPWKIDFDPMTGDLYIADVGQGSFEEINYQPAASTGGEDYGWRCWEANRVFNFSNCDSTGANLTFPAHAYPHNPGSFCTGSITGGIVYRGSVFPALYGHYLFADYCSGMMGSIYNDGTAFVSDTLAQFSALEIASFGRDNEGGIYFSALSEGAIYKFDAVTASTEVGSVHQEIKLLQNPIYDNILRWDCIIEQAVVVDALGRQLMSKENCSDIRLDEVASGVYYFIGINNDNKVVVPFVVE